jgi:RNA polymerase sigma-70 factor (ECF subfamily)
MTMDDDRRVRRLSELVEKNYALLYRYACRLTGSAADAEDLTQHAFLTAQAKLDQLREPAHASAWLCAIVRNTYLKSLRKRNGATLVSLDKVAEPTEVIPEDAALDREELQRVLNELPEEFRTTLILFYFEEFSYREIAEQMDVPLGTVMSRLARGKSHLRRRLVSYQPAASE